MPEDYFHPRLEDGTAVFFNQRSEPYIIGSVENAPHRLYAAANESVIDFVVLSELEDWERRREDHLAARMEPISAITKALPLAIRRRLYDEEFPLRPSIMVGKHPSPVFNDRQGDIYILLPESDGSVEVVRKYVVGEFHDKFHFAKLSEDEIGRRINQDRRWMNDLPISTRGWSSLCNRRRPLNRPSL